MHHVKVTIEHAPGHPLGVASLLLPPHPSAGKFGLSLGLEFEDFEGELGGKVRGVCSVCGRSEQVAWRRVHARILELRAQGRHAGTLLIHE